MLTTSKAYKDPVLEEQIEGAPSRDIAMERESSTMARGFEPPYRLVSPGGEPGVNPEAPYASHLRAKEFAVTDQEWSDATSSDEARAQVGLQVDSVRAVMMPLTMLLAGSVFFLFGLVMFLFAQNGVLTLRWNANYAFIYLLSGVPLLYYGWVALSSVDDQAR
jgi:hypothetical protein